MRLGIFGGTFDPPHLGHALACLWALETGEVDGILMVPTMQHAFGKQPQADFSARMAMCGLAVLHLGNFVEVSDVEARRPGVSYMIDTLRSLAEERPGDAFRLVIGTDVAAELPKWREGSEVVRLAPPLILPRALSGEAVAGALPMISSSAVREALKSEKDVDKFLGSAVRAYIRRHNLYGHQNPIDLETNQ